MPNLIIIGNGFDLAHNLETSYPQFIRSIVESNNKEVKHLDLFNSGLYRNYEELKQTERLSVHLSDTVKNYLLKNLIQNFFLKNWSDVEEMYFKQLNSIGNTNAPYQKPEPLNQQFEQIKGVLKQYLSEQENKSLKIESYDTMFKALDSEDTLILNFNYTKTVERLYDNSLKRSKKIYFHGKLDSTTNPIVFGYAASHDESRKLIEKNNNEFMKNIKKHLYKRSENEALLTKYLKDHIHIDVSILGHSCGLSDKLILNQILTDENVETIRTFYFEKYENYFDTIVNIDRIMNDDDKFRKRIVDFNSSIRMPQHNDVQNQINDFKSHIGLLKEPNNEPMYFIGKNQSKHSY